MKIFVLVILTIINSPVIVNGAEVYGDFHFVRYLKTTSAASFLADIPGAHPLIGQKIEIKIKGIEVPSINGTCEKERVSAKKGMELLQFILKRGRDISLHNVERGRRFRLSAVVLVNGKDIREILTAKGLAVRNVNRKKNHNWCSSIGKR